MLMVNEKQKFAEIIGKEFGAPDVRLGNIDTIHDLEKAEVTVERKVGASVLNESRGPDGEAISLDTPDEGPITVIHDPETNQATVIDEEGERAVNDVFDGAHASSDSRGEGDDTFHIPSPRS